MASELKYEEWVATVDADSEDVTKDKDKLYDLVKQGFDQFGGEKSSELMWRMGRAAYKVAAAAEVSGDMKKHKKMLKEAEDRCKQAVKLDDGSADSHVWLATVLGKSCDHLGSKERVETGKLVQQHLEKAISIRKSDFITFYTYGRWCFEVAALSWIERKIAKTLFGEVPEATYEDAMDKFKQVQELKPEWKANLYWLAKTAAAKKDYVEAIKYADLAAGFPSVDEEDVIYEKEIAVLQKKYESHRPVAA